MGFYWGIIDFLRLWQRLLSLLLNLFYHFFFFLFQHLLVFVIIRALSFVWLGRLLIALLVGSYDRSFSLVGPPVSLSKHFDFFFFWGLSKCHGINRWNFHWGPIVFLHVFYLLDEVSIVRHIIYLLCLLCRLIWKLIFVAGHAFQLSWWIK